MPEEKEERKPFITFSFTEEGVFDRYAGIYLHLPLEKPPTGEEIAIMVGTIKTYAKCWEGLQGTLRLAQAQRDGLTEPPPGAAGLRAPQQTPPGEPREPSKEDSPHCKAKGVWAAAKGRWPEGFKPDWKHKETRLNQKGELYCPTPISKDDEGNLIWCGWRAVEGENGWEEWDLNEPED